MDQYLRREEVERATGLCDPQLWREEKAGRFPRRRRLTARTVGWLRSEIESWQESRPTHAGDFPNLKYHKDRAEEA